ncbi:MAG: VOC family protein [Verrucomicrobiales bacterium]|nr:VOC family protein [Verrucomicrobiales bacterium]
MTTITPYLQFSGQLEEALNFYSEFLEVEIAMLLRFSESPDPVPEGMLAEGFDQKIMHASFSIQGTPLMASDGCSPDETFRSFSLSLTMPNEDEAHRVFETFARSGNVEMPIDKTFWSPCFGMVTDKFGLQWMVTVPDESQSDPEMT